MKKLQYFILILLFATLFNSCKKEIDTAIDANAPAPAQVSAIKVTVTPGGAIITYKIPVDANLYYVKAVYEIQPGVFREAKSSYYNDTLTLVGFGDTLSHEVKIYSIGKNKKESKVVPITVIPLTPPVKSVFKTLDLEATFGGVSVVYQNSSQADLSIVVLMDTTGQNKWVPVTTYYTGALEGNFSARGLDTIERKFAVFVRDRWNNKSDTLIKSLKPVYEQLIPRALFKAIHLPTDSWTPNAAYNLEKMWDGIVNVSENIFLTNDFVKMPQWFTVDLGQNVVFSRIKMYQRVNYPYSVGWVKKFEIWGSNSLDVDGGWAHWQKLGGFESIKPSGLPDPNYTTNDLDFVKAGEDFNFVDVIPAVRYIRFVMVESRGGVGKYMLGELTFYGQIKP